MLTERDLNLVRFVGRAGIARTTDLAIRFGMGRTMTYQRVSGLVERRLLERHRIVYHDDALLIATGKGLNAGGLDHLKKARVSLGKLEHMLRCTEFMTAYEPRLTDRQMLTEREHTAAENMTGHAIGSAIVGRATDGAQRLHRPDFVVGTDGFETNLVSIEIELTQKATSRLDAIIRGYLRNRRVGAVHYWAPKSVATAVRRAIDRAGAGGLVTVHELQFEQP